MPEADQPSRGVLASLGRLCDSGFALLQNRAELFAVELREEKSRQIEVFLWAGAVVFLGAMALAMATVTIVVAFWDTARLAVLVGLSSFYMLMTIGAFLTLRNRLTKAPPPFAETIDEIKKDRDWLAPRK